MCLILDDMSGTLTLARFCVQMLSSHALETNPNTFKSRLVFFQNSRTRLLALSYLGIMQCIPLPKSRELFPFITLRSRKIGTPTKFMIRPVLLLTEIGSLLSSATNSPAKYPSAKKSTGATMSLETGLNLCLLSSLNI